jgi:serine protease AprX
MRVSLRLLPLLFFMVSAVRAEPVKIWVSLRDKGPIIAKTLQAGRTYEDAPVYAPYLQQLREAGFAVAVTLKWQNRVSGWADTAALAAIRSLPFVTAVEGMPRKAPVSALPVPKTSLPKAGAGIERYGVFHEMFDSVGAKDLADTVRARGFRPGEGLRIAVMDEDFYLGHGAFDSLFARGAIVDQYDFVANAPQSVYPANQAGSHGAWVLSLIGGNAPGVAMGLAPYAKFLLYRTEKEGSENYVEEDYLAAALERAVDSGAQVINISLGYRYDFTGQGQIPYKSMDGRTRPASLAALGAARRGALVVVAIGNEGGARPDSGGGPSTATVTSPADADSILTVGIQLNGARCGYSSTGPTYDGRLKPELTSVGLGGGCNVYVASPGTETGTEIQSGTSFAAPVIAGAAALLRQLHPDTAASAQRIRQALLVTARRSHNPDNLVGNGLARVSLAHCALLLDSLVQNPGCLPPVAPSAVKGVLVWRGGQVRTLPWPNSLDLTRARMWDLQGRLFPLQGSLTEEGEVLLQSRRRLAPGTFILRIPRAPDDADP